MFQLSVLNARRKLRKLKAAVVKKKRVTPQELGPELETTDSPAADISESETAEKDENTADFTQGFGSFYVRGEGRGYVWNCLNCSDCRDEETTIYGAS